MAVINQISETTTLLDERLKKMLSRVCITECVPLFGRRPFLMFTVGSEKGQSGALGSGCISVSCTVEHVCLCRQRQEISISSRGIFVPMLSPFFLYGFLGYVSVRVLI